MPSRQGSMGCRRTSDARIHLPGTARFVGQRLARGGRRDGAEPGNSTALDRGGNARSSALIGRDRSGGGVGRLVAGHEIPGQSSDCRELGRRWRTGAEGVGREVRCTSEEGARPSVRLDPLFDDDRSEHRQGWKGRPRSVRPGRAWDHEVAAPSIAENSRSGRADGRGASA